MPASTKRVGSVDPATPGGPLNADLDQATRLIESERAQIGHEIHDGLLPLIFAASATISSIIDRKPGNGPGEAEPTTDDETLEKLQQVSVWLGDAMQVGRALLTQVYPPDLIGTRWAKAARDTIERLFPNAEINIGWQIDPQVNETSAPIALAAYRITVEAVRNAIGHAKASEVVVVGETKTDGFQVCIRDNGAGFDRSQVPPDRYGIRSMTDRAALVGGRVQIDSRPGGPTTVTFVSHCGEIGGKR